VHPNKTSGLRRVGFAIEVEFTMSAAPWLDWHADDFVYASK
jgi:hypothetical protein